MITEDDFDADEIISEPEDYSIIEDDEDSNQELILGQNRIINPEELLMIEDDFYDL